MSNNTKSPFAEMALLLFQKGYKILPIQPKTKIPGQYIRGNWTSLCEWQRLQLTETEIESYSKWPDAGVGVLLGPASDIIALDFDYDVNGLHERILELLPESPVQKSGAKGFTVFYRYSGESSQKFKPPGFGKGYVVELLSTGNTTILPPSVHPQGMIYQYLTEKTLSDLSPKDLPILPDGFCYQVEQLMEEYSVLPENSFSSFILSNFTHYDSIEIVKSALNYIDSNDYELWYKTGMSLKQHLEESGFVLWDEWSRRSSKYNASEMRSKWNSFKRDARKIGSLFYDARRNGFLFPIKNTVNNGAGDTSLKTVNLLNVQGEREQLSQDLCSIMMEENSKPMIHCFCHPTGMGKTTSVVDIIQQILQENELKSKSQRSKNILILTKQKEEALLNYIQPLSATCPERIMGIEGRNQNQENPFFCSQTSVILTALVNRHSRHCNCDPLCSYTKLKREMKLLLTQRVPGQILNAVIVSTYSSFLNENDLDDFDLIIIDESIENANIVEPIVINSDDILNVQKRLNVLLPEEHPFRHFLQALQHVIAENSATAGHEHPFKDFHPLWEKFYQGEELSELLKQFSLIEESKLYRESLFKSKRFIKELMEAILDVNKVIYLNGTQIEFFRKRECLEFLKEKTVISLDATPNRALLKDIFGEDKVNFHGKHSSSIAPNVQIVQYWGRKYTKENISKGKESRNLNEINTLIDHILAKEEPLKPLLVLPKLVKESDLIPFPGKMIHFGGNTRASNQYSDSDLMIILTRYLEPPRITEMRVNALRTSQAISGESQQIKKYMRHRTQTKRLYDEDWQHPDLLIQATSDHFTMSEMIQTIGRLRAINRENEYLKVFFISGYILPDLFVDEVVWIQDILKQVGHSSARKLAKTTEERNKVVYDEKDQKIQEVLSKNPGISQRKLAKITGFSPTTIKKHLPS